MDIAEAKKVLSIHGEFNKDLLRQRYRQSAIKSHPDRNLGNPHAAAKFQSVSNAYLTLSAYLNRGKALTTTVDRMVQGFSRANLSKPPAVVVFLTLSLLEAYTGTLAPLEVDRWIEKDGEKEEEVETIYVEVREGVDSGEVIILEGKGNKRSDGVSSDLKVFIKMENWKEEIFLMTKTEIF